MFTNNLHFSCHQLRAKIYIQQAFTHLRIILCSVCTWVDVCLQVGCNECKSLSVSMGPINYGSTGPKGHGTEGHKFKVYWDTGYGKYQK